MRCMNALVASSEPANRLKQHTCPTHRYKAPDWEAAMAALEGSAVVKASKRASRPVVDSMATAAAAAHAGAVPHRGAPGDREGPAVVAPRLPPQRHWRSYGTEGCHGRCSPGGAARRLPVVVPAHHLRPLRQGGDAQREPCRP